MAGKICSATNTATHAQMATTNRLFRRNARITATTSPVSAEYRLEVERNTSGMVIAVRQAYGT